MTPEQLIQQLQTGLKNGSIKRDAELKFFYPQEDKSVDIANVEPCTLKGKPVVVLGESTLKSKINLAQVHKSKKGAQSDLGSVFKDLFGGGA